MRQTNRETKGNQTEKDKMLLVFDKVGKGCVLDKSREVITEVVKNSYKGTFITEGYFLFFLITSKRFMKSSVVKGILSIILFQSFIDLT